MKLDSVVKAGAILLGLYLVLDWASKQPWCGPACQRFVGAGETQVAQDFWRVV
jgi:hypothetical protein